MRLLARLTAGFLLWAFGFALLYGLHGLGCAGGWEATPLAGSTLFRWILLPVWMLLCGGAAAITWRARRWPQGFERRVGLASSLAALAATIVTGAPLALASACS